MSTVKQRFMAKVAPPNENGCMFWTGSIDVNGYGHFYLGGGRGRPKFIGAHRFAYELWAGQIPEGLQLDHLCKIPRCVAPGHLEPVTARENVHRSANPAAQNLVKTHCSKGHPLSGENLHPADAKRGRRQCRTCKLEYQREFDRKRVPRRRSRVAPPAE